MQEETTAKQPVEQNPAKGGSYLRNDDGTLDLVHATQPATPATATEPAQADTTSKE